MFRPNRIGTPTFHSSDLTASTANWSPNAYNNNSANFGGNVINASPLLDIGRSALRWIGAATEVIPLNARLVLGQQFTVTKPLTGDAAGVELNHAYLGQAPASANISSVFFKVQTAAASTFGQVDASDYPTPLQDHSILNSEIDTVYVRSVQHQSNVVILSLSDPGTYFHGICISDNSGANWNLDYFYMVASIRQLNDQQTVAYRDTLR